jgi:hypothetical protein
MSYLRVDDPRSHPPWRNEQGMALMAALVVIFLLMGVSAIATFGGYTNLLTSTNLRLAARAQAQAETNVNEALYRLALPTTVQEQVAPDLSDPDCRLKSFSTPASALTKWRQSKRPGTGRLWSIAAPRQRRCNIRRIRTAT